MIPRTHRQKEILTYISHFIHRHGHEPSYAQIARHFGISSKATVAKHITALEKHGLVQRQRTGGVFRLVLQEEVSESRQIPLLGRVAAGEPLETFSGVVGMMTVPSFMLNKSSTGRVYALKVVGDSMIEEHICDGDVVLIENRVEAGEGEIVVAKLEDDKVTLKRYFERGDEVELRPANPDLVSAFMPRDKVQVQGIYCGLLRPATH